MVLNSQEEAGLKLKARTCQLFREEIPFHYHITLAGGIGEVRAWRIPNKHAL